MVRHVLLAFRLSDFITPLIKLAAVASQATSSSIGVPDVIDEALSGVGYQVP